MVYWVAPQIDGDSLSYSVRERTKKAAVAAANERNLVARNAGRDEPCGPVFKVEFEYRDAFDLISRCLGEGGVEFDRARVK
jgi:hypothetical protein